jgi:two-component system nitrogen regulation sensor histidine kinase NtrY
VILEDVSDAARLERLAAWQEVARRVAHEIKNPLTPIQISADRLRRRLLPALQDDPVHGPILEECLGQISKQVRVIRDLVREFSEFAKLPEPNFDRVLIVDCFQSLLDDYRFTHPQCRFEFEVDQKLLKTLVRADREYLRRLFVNLADNALQSMEDAQTPEPRFRVRMESGDDNISMLRIVFEDNGPGIPESMREKIFDPYMTSKASGLGLGLAIVRRIAIEHLGRVRCEEGEGARFVLEVPTLGGENHPHV